MSDRELLQEVLARDEALSQVELQAFTSMLEAIEAGTYAGMTEKQRVWAKGVAERLGLDCGEPKPAENLVSSGKVKVTLVERANLQQFLGSLPKALLPPHRRCQLVAGCQKQRGHQGACQ